MDEVTCIYENFHGSFDVDDDEYCAWNDHLNAYHCTICPATMNSEQSFYMHRGGQKHHKKLATMKLLNPKLKRENESEKNQEEVLVDGHIDFPKSICTKKMKKTPELQKRLQMTTATIVGLDHVVEIQLLNHLQCYKCKLCSIECQSDSIESHLIGFEHRMNYLKRKLPNIFQKINNDTSNRTTKHSLARMHSERLEKRLGRGEISVEVEMKTRNRQVTKGGSNDTGKTRNMSFEEKTIHFILESVNSDVSKKMDALVFGSENLLEQELRNPEFSNVDVASIQEACEKLRNRFIKKELKSMNQEEIGVLTNNIKMIRDGDSASVNEIFKMPTAKVGEAMIEVLRDLDEKDEDNV